MKCEYCGNYVKGKIAYSKTKTYHPDCLIKEKNEKYWRKREKWRVINKR